MRKDEGKSLSALSAPLTRRNLLTRVVPTGLAAALLGADVSSASAHTLKAEHPMSLSTSVGVSAGSAFGSTIMATTTALDGRILYNSWVLGDRASAWVEINGNGRTNTVPASSYWGGSIHSALSMAPTLP